MPASRTRGGFYAVQKGFAPGVYTSWDECAVQVNGYVGARHKKFKTLAEAQAFVDGTNTVKAALAVPDARHAPVASSSKLKPASSVQKRDSAAVEEAGWDVVYSDGACKGNGKAGSRAGIGIWWGPNDPRRARCPGDQTNNRAELIAVIRVLELTPLSKTPLMIKTDSKYTIMCIEQWIKKWQTNNWHTASGDPVKNAPVIRYLAALIDDRARSGQKVCFRHVKGHAGIEGNEGADAEANSGAVLPVVAERDWVGLREGLERCGEGGCGVSVPFSRMNTHFCLSCLILLQVDNREVEAGSSTTKPSVAGEPPPPPPPPPPPGDFEDFEVTQFHFLPFRNRISFSYSVYISGRRFFESRGARGRA
ncbi:ribonuclease H-like protein [Rickenella mellea]|uniref:ribonuclease H n=1 Tax=Rickenella mellea TaxID=50990 RepID=A0A4Y7PJ77_9AGAM|nr:ribonuclease H-like protein [Rickenella mellea]